MPKSIFSDIANEIINDEELTSEFSNILKEGFTSLTLHDWDAALSDYIRFLVARVIGIGLGVKAKAPFHVEILWTLHLVETASYRKLEKIVIAKVKEINEDIVLVEHIDHTKQDKKNDHTKQDKKNSRVKATETLYSLLGLVPWDDETIECDQTSPVESVESVRPKTTVSAKKQGSEKKKAAKQLVISSKVDGDKKDKGGNYC